ncbi:hypothetical protein G6038_10310 [Rhodococcus sp. 14C212]|uniref:UGSC family (seleno)protein n=1 Tax=Rhodococcus TaxID=1827 RepID=UPI0013EA3C64|nr:hypothetical protein [Rhodococcus sp. 14C212]NGP05863.1 hypothetical protein [Rhodococcus sp. 14C212]
MNSRSDQSHSSPQFSVLAPLGERRQQEGSLAPRLSTLSGKRIAFVFDYAFRGDEMFARFMEQAHERFADVTFLDPDKFGNFHGPAEEGEEALERLAESLESQEFDAAIVGVGA